MIINIIVPSFNEENRVVATVQKIMTYSDCKIIVIDDGSNMKSRKLLEILDSKSPKVTLLKHQKNKGKGEAMKTGVLHALKNNADAVIFIDADGQHDPSLLPFFEAAILKHELVFGYRLLKNNAPFVRKLGNFIFKKIALILFKIKRKDLLCGFFAFRLSSFDKLSWSSSQYGVESEIAAKIGKLKLPFHEIKINTTYISGKKGMHFFDALKVLAKIPSWYFEK